MTRRRFKFRLDPVRTVRKHSESLAMQALASELAEAGELELRLGAAEQRLVDAREEGSCRLGAMELAQRQLYRERVERELEDARMRAGVQARAVQHARDRLDLAAREREALDRLQQRRLAEHVQELHRAEWIAGDELATKMQGNGFGGAAPGVAG